jgi:hypothetical protein
LVQTIHAVPAADDLTTRDLDTGIIEGTGSIQVLLPGIEGDLAIGDIGRNVDIQAV